MIIFFLKKKVFASSKTKTIRVTSTIFENEDLRKKIAELSDCISKIGFYGTRFANALMLHWIETGDPLPKPDQAFFLKVFEIIAGYETDDDMKELKKEWDVPTISLEKEYSHALVLLARQNARNTQIHFRALKKRVVEYSNLNNF